MVDTMLMLRSCVCCQKLNRYFSPEDASIVTKNNNIISEEEKRYDEVRIKSNISGRNCIRPKLWSFCQNTGYPATRFNTSVTGIIIQIYTLNVNISTVT